MVAKRMHAKQNEVVSAQHVLLLRLIDEAYDHRAWLGPNLRGSIRGVSAEHAAWRPRPGRRNIAEIVLHCAYWKYAIRRRIFGGRRGMFPLKGSNWFAVPAKLTDDQWRDYVAMLDDAHRALRERIAQAPAAWLSTSPRKDQTAAENVYGVAMHDVYHTGQIHTITALHKQAKRGVTAET